MNDTLTRTACQGVGSDGKVLGLLQGLGLKECEAALTDRSYLGIVGRTRGLERNVYDDGEICQLIEMRDRLNENGGICGNGDELARLCRLEDAEKRVGMLADGDNLGWH